jgi:hypothetical protein
VEAESLEKALSDGKDADALLTSISDAAHNGADKAA